MKAFFKEKQTINYTKQLLFLEDLVSDIHDSVSDVNRTINVSPQNATENRETNAGRAKRKTNKSATKHQITRSSKMQVDGHSHGFLHQRNENFSVRHLHIAEGQ